MPPRLLRQGLALVVSVSICCACIGREEPIPRWAREWSSFVPEAPPDGYEVGSRRLVALALPTHGKLALLDPAEGTIWQFGDLERGTRGAMALAPLDGRVVLTDVWGAGVAIVDPLTGTTTKTVGLGRIPIASSGHTIEPPRHGQDIVVGPDAAIYVLVDEEINRGGFVFKLDPRSLEVVGRTKLGPYPARMAFDDSGRLWTVGGFASQGD